MDEEIEVFKYEKRLQDRVACRLRLGIEMAGHADTDARK
jgi:hypothetical protein